MAKAPKNTAASDVNTATAVAEAPTAKSKKKTAVAETAPAAPAKVEITPRERMSAVAGFKGDVYDRPFSVVETVGEGDEAVTTETEYVITNIRPNNKRQVVCRSTDGNESKLMLTYQEAYDLTGFETL